MSTNARYVIRGKVTALSAVKPFYAYLRFSHGNPVFRYGVGVLGQSSANDYVGVDDATRLDGYEAVSVYSTLVGKRAAITTGGTWLDEVCIIDVREVTK